MIKTNNKKDFEIILERFKKAIDTGDNTNYINGEEENIIRQNFGLTVKPKKIIDYK